MPFFPWIAPPHPPPWRNPSGNLGGETTNECVIPRAEFAGVALGALPLHGDRRRLLPLDVAVIVLFRRFLDDIVVVILERHILMAFIEVKLKVREVALIIWI